MDTDRVYRMRMLEANEDSIEAGVGYGTGWRDGGSHRMIGIGGGNVGIQIISDKIPGPAVASLDLANE